LAAALLNTTIDRNSKNKNSLAPKNTMIYMNFLSELGKSSTGAAQIHPQFRDWRISAQYYQTLIRLQKTAARARTGTSFGRPVASIAARPAPNSGLGPAVTLSHPAINGKPNIPTKEDSTNK